ncbi:unnamed protein product [Camellia sinensis]
MCGKPIGPQSQKLYDEYKKIFEDYILSKVLPSLREKKDENLLQELAKRWNNTRGMEYKHEIGEEEARTILEVIASTGKFCSSQLYRRSFFYPAEAL